MCTFKRVERRGNRCATRRRGRARARWMGKLTGARRRRRRRRATATTTTTTVKKSSTKKSNGMSHIDRFGWEQVRDSTTRSSAVATDGQTYGRFDGSTARRTVVGVRIIHPSVRRASSVDDATMDARKVRAPTTRDALERASAISASASTASRVGVDRRPSRRGAALFPHRRATTTTTTTTTTTNDARVRTNERTTTDETTSRVDRDRRRARRRRGRRNERKPSRGRRRDARRGTTTRIEARGARRCERKRRG